MIELFSIHIPKTAGRSLLHVLNKVYGDEHVLVVNRKLFKINREEGLIDLRSRIKPSTKVIHGHIHASELQELFEENPSAKLITFLRDPVERVISHYYYEKKILEEKGHISGFKEVPLNSILEYANHPESQNLMHRFLEGSDPGKFFFVGRVEQFDNDIRRLGKLLNWPGFEIPEENINTDKRKTADIITNEEKVVIRSLNQLDENIYHQFLNLSQHKIKCWIASFPRSGNTYFRNILYYVYGLESGTWHKETAFRVDDDYDQHPFVKTHLLPAELVPDNPSIPAIYLIRDGRDAMVSIAHHRSDLVSPGSDLLQNMQEAIVAAEGSFFGGWSNNVNEWLQRASLVIRYEDLIRDPKKVFMQVEKVVDLPEADWSKLPTFEELKSGKAKYGSGTKNKNPKFNPEIFSEKFFRKGKSGGWKEEMPDHLQDLFRNHHGDTMERTGYTDYTGVSGQNTLLDYKVMVKMGRLTPVQTVKKINILIEATKLAHPGNDGIKRYLILLLKGLEEITKYGDPKWNFELLIGRKFYPLASYKDVISIEEVENLHPYEKLLLGFKQIVKSSLPEKLYNAGSGIYKKTDVRKMLRLIQQKTSIKQKLVFYEKLDTMKDVVDLLHVPLPQNSEHFKTLSHNFLITVHDLTHKLFPEFHEQANITLAEEGMNFIKKKNAEVISVSKSTTNDLLKYYPIPAEKIHLVYEAPDRDLFKWNLNKEVAGKVREKYKIGKAPYFLCLSTIEPRKNLPNTIRAFNSFIKSNPNADVNLVISGNFGWKTDHLSRELHLENPRIIFTGYVDDVDLNIVYSEAVALCYVSFYEGFGLPPLEAMSCRTPVIYGNNSSMKEIIGDAGLPADANNVTDIASQMNKIFSDPQFRNELAVKAHHKSFEFSRRRSIYDTLSVYKKLVEKSK